MEHKRKRRNIVVAILLLALAGGMAALPYVLRSSKPEPADKASYLSAQVERRDILSTISGGGTLTQQDGLPARVLKGVEVTEYLVANGDWVEEGQPIALVDRLSVMQTIAILQENLDYLGRQLKRNPENVSTDAIFLPAPGRVKEIYAQKGDKVSDVMAEHGCLAVVSLDGMMAVQIDTQTPLAAGSDVIVVFSDGSQLPGRVEVSQGSHLTVTLTDDGPKLGERVEILTEEGETLGSGELYVHSAWNVTAVSGEITYVAVKPERTLGLGGHLFNLKNVDFSQKNRQFSEQRREYEEAMIKLFELYRDGAITAPAAGKVEGIDKARVGLMRAGEAEAQIMFLSGLPEARLVLLGDVEEGETLEPTQPPEPDPPEPTQPPEPDPRKYDPNQDSPSLYYNRAAMIGSTSLVGATFLVDKDFSTVSSYASAPSSDFSNVNSVTGTSGAKVYCLIDGVWTAYNPWDVAASVGSLFYFVYKNPDDTNPMWIMQVPAASSAPQIKPGGGGWGGGGGGGEEQFDMYELTETELFRVVPQDEMTVEVSIDELDILSVAVGQTAEITVDALPGRAYSGTVKQIDPNGKNTGGSTKYTITIAIDRDENMLQGMNATAILTVGVTENVLTIPAAALNQRGSRSFVYTGYDPESRTLLNSVDVTVGVSDGQTAEILSGLNEGDTVWYAYYEAEKLPSFLSSQPGEIM